MKLVIMNGVTPSPEFRKDHLSEGSPDDFLLVEKESLLACSLDVELEDGENNSAWSRVRGIFSGCKWNLKLSVCLMARWETVLGQIRFKRDEENNGLWKLKQSLALLGLRLEDVQPGVRITIAVNRTILEFKGFVYESHPGIDEGTTTDLYMDGPEDGLPLHYIFVDVDVFDQIYNALEHDIRVSFIIDFAQIPGLLRDGHSVCRDICNASFFADYRLVSRENGEVACHKAVLTELSTEFKNHIERNQAVTNLDLTTFSLNGLKAFLYYRSLDGYENNRTVLPELFLFAKDYNVKSLLTYIVDVIMTKNVEWFDSTSAHAMFSTAYQANLGESKDKVCCRLVTLCLHYRVQTSDYSDFFHKKYYKNIRFFRAWSYYLSIAPNAGLPNPTENA